MKAYLALGKAGDLIAALPILHHEFSTTGKPANLVVSRNYAPVISRVPFVKPCIYDGSWLDLKGALKFAKQKFHPVISLSTFGEDFPIEHRRSSFQLDCYDRAGMLKQWDALPLSGLARGSFRNGGSACPTILFSDHSQSSPFLQKEELNRLLVDNFPKHKIVRLSEHRLPHLFDFLEWYDNAQALVTVETSHLHLSAATATPVFALATDKPSRWHGSCWSKRFAFYCRYSEFNSRKDELIETMTRVLAKRKPPEVVCLN